MECLITTAAGHTVRARSRCRYVLIGEDAAGTEILKRSDSYKTIREAYERATPRPEGRLFVIDTHRTYDRLRGDYGPKAFEAVVMMRVGRGRTPGDPLADPREFKVSHPVRSAL